MGTLTARPRQLAGDDPASVHAFFKAISCLQFLHSTYKRYSIGHKHFPRMAGFIITNVDLFSHKGRHDHPRSMTPPAKDHCRHSAELAARGIMNGARNIVSQPCRSRKCLEHSGRFGPTGRASFKYSSRRRGSTVNLAARRQSTAWFSYSFFSAVASAHARTR